ncbi:abortive infection system toxin AbiGii family protein [Aminipila sp.]|uniref:abortive infection system toxin AbiGii family protein n=1 Tax=Aminipila sp. TaxID=2060095 RepID=UPI0028995A84|nr:abortive infection system toxin AbiGii family protein [Aminipila sp.]
MYINFNEILKPQEPIKIPKEIIAQLNKQLPDGLKYVQVTEDACGVVSEDNVLNFNVNLNLSDLPTQYSRFVKTNEDLWEYLYRTQTPLKCDTNEDGTITVNNHKIPTSDLVKFPLSGNSCGDYSEFKIVPQPFPEIGKVVFTSGGISVPLNLKRIPYESMDMISICSEDNSWLSINILFSEKTGLATVNFTFKFEIINCVEELILALKFSNKIFSGDISINGYILNGKISSNKEDNIVTEDTIKFWEQVLKLEKILKVKFDCSLPITQVEAQNFEVLFHCLVEKKPYKEWLEADNNTGLTFSEYPSIELEKNKQILLSFLESKSWDILSQKFTTYNCCMLFNSEIDSIEAIDDANTDNKFFLKLKPAEKKKMYRSMRLFKTEKLAEKFHLKAMNNNKLIDIMKDAEEV